MKLFRAAYDDTPPPPKAEKTFTQDDITRIVNETLAKERTKAEKEKKELVTKVEQLGLTEKQKSELETEVERLRVEGLSKEEKAKVELESLKKKYDQDIAIAKAQAEKFFGVYKAEKIHRELLDAANEHGAWSPTQVVDLLGHKAAIIEKDGQFTTILKLNLKGEEKEFSPTDAVKALKDDTEKYGNLFRSGAAGGLGGSNSNGTGKGPDLRSMPMDEFVKRFREDPRSLGLRAR